MVANHPWPQAPEDITFFPTLFWLTCPKDTEAVGKLEGRGYMQELLAELDQDPDFWQSLQAAHADYRQLRSDLGPAGTSNADARTDALSQSGIGGTKTMRAIKCLHMHYAHYLAGGRNPVGFRVAQKLAAQTAPSACRECGQKTHLAGVAE